MKRFFCFLTHSRVYVDNIDIKNKHKYNKTNGVKPFCHVCKKTNTECNHN